MLLAFDNCKYVGRVVDQKMDRGENMVTVLRGGELLTRHESTWHYAAVEDVHIVHQGALHRLKEEFRRLRAAALIQNPEQREYTMKVIDGVHLALRVLDLEIPRLALLEKEDGR